MSSILLLLGALSARAEDTCTAVPDPDGPLRTIQVSQIPALVAEHKGCVVLLELYASWCGTCTKTAPAVTELVGRLQPEGLVPIGVSVDSSTERMQAWRQSHGREYAPVVLESWTLGSLTQQFSELGVTFNEAIPLFVLFDKDGNAVLHLTEPKDLSVLEERARGLF